MNIAKKLLKALMWLTLLVTGLIIVIYLLLLGVNWYDQPPSEASSRLMNLSASRPSVADQDNAYVYLMGFSVEPAQDPRAWGLQRIASAQEQLKKSPNAFPAIEDLPGKDHDFKAQRPSELQALIDTCKEVDAKCLKTLENGEKTIAAWLASEAWLLERYRTLLAHPAYQETLPFDMRTPIPPYLAVHEGQKLLLVQAWQLAGQGDTAGVKKLLTEDVQFWRQSLGASDTVLAKMIAARALQRHFTWSNIVLRRLPPAVMRQGVPEQWMTPLSESERSMLRSFAGESQAFTSMINQIGKGSIVLDTSEANWTLNNNLAPILEPLLQRQDTRNKYAEQLTASDAALQVPYEKYPAAVERARVMEDKERDESVFIFFIKRVYNPVGNILLSTGRLDANTYAVRVSDLEGLRRLTLVTTELRSQGATSEQLAQKLTEATARNPYTKEPFVWDDSAKSVVFTGLEKSARGRHALVY